MKKVSLLALLVVLVLLVSAGAVMASNTALDPRAKDVTLFYSDGTAIVNANMSGVKGAANGTGGTWSLTGFSRNNTGNSTHGTFLKNTNSCATCHITHAAQGADLLFRSGVYATCAACHDGTGGGSNRNVFRSSETLVNGAIRNNTLMQSATNVSAAVAGTFNVNNAMNPSVHRATGDVKIASAPGGNLTGKKWDGTAEGSAHAGQWSNDFTCSSCHNPHGSYSYRYLHYNPNRLSSRPREEGGLRRTGLTVQQEGSDLYAFSGTTKVAGPWVYGYTSRTDLMTYYFIVTDVRGTAGLGAGNLINNFTIYYNEGRFKWTGTNALTETDLANLRVEVSPVAVVTAPTVNTTTRKIEYLTNGQNYNFFCASCHTDYERTLTTTTAFGQEPVTGGTAAANKTGIFSKAHRHTTWRGANPGMEVIAKSGTSDNLLCVSCHFVHGADSSMMKTADEVVIGVAVKDIRASAAYIPVAWGTGDAAATAYFEANKDVNTSSALKRYTNMSVCYKCHTTSRAESLKNTTFFWTQYDEITNIWHKYNPLGQYR